MEMCSSTHDEVCFVCRNCPVCALQEELDIAESEISSLERQIADLENQE
jgi:polyhydroxyalkanoate synthesis regulator phasin